MIGAHTIQEAIVSLLKANTAITTFLDDAANIKELTWQGPAFSYPAVRVGAGTLIAEGGDTSACYSTVQSFDFTVHCYTEDDSSLNCNNLANLVNNALVEAGTRLYGSGFSSSVILLAAADAAIRTDERLWVAVNNYSCKIYES